MGKIVLVGYMAVGKTTIAKLLSEKINFRAVDLDDLIEKKVGLSIKEIFNQKGEIYFRKIEHQIFKDIIQSDESLIISTGGGTPCYAENHLFLTSKNVNSFYLKASINVLLARLKTEKGKRPVLANKSDDDLQEFIAKHLFERSYFYNQAGFTVMVDDKSSDEIAEEIIKLLH